jgi:hypothetical protein
MTAMVLRSAGRRDADGGPQPAQAGPLEAVLAQFERDRDEHVTSGPDHAEDLRRIEQELGLPLPETLRRFLERLGGGLYYQRHEILGCRRVMIHDIELVPDLVSLRRSLERQGALPAGSTLLPFHRAGSAVHALSLDGRDSPAVRALDGSPLFPDLAAFLRSLTSPATRGL